MSKQSRTNLTDGARKRIKEHYEAKIAELPEGETYSIAQLARDFGCSYHQARNAAHSVTNSEYRNQPKRKKRPANSKVNQQEDIFKIFEMECRATLLQLESDRNIAAEDRAKILQNVMASMASMQKTQLERYMKRADAEIIVRLIRMFRPGMTESDCIKLYYEASEMKRIEASS